jgi:lipoyl-dependent peroxiredoxin
MKRSAKAMWSGNIKGGKGVISSESQTLKDVSYSFAQRFGTEPGTNPEELIAAAHAGCFAMAFSGELEKRKLVPESLEVKANVTIEKAGEGFEIPGIHLDVEAHVQGDENVVREAAEEAKNNCPVSKLLNAEITMDLSVTSSESRLAG